MRKFILPPLFALLSFTGFEALALCSGEADESVQQSLVFAIDSSSSMDLEETKLQMEGYEDAFKADTVSKDLMHCGCTEITVFLWAQRNHILMKRRKIKSPEDIQDIISLFKELSSTQTQLHKKYNLGPVTLVRRNLNFALDFLIEEDNKASRKAILIHGDGQDHYVDDQKSRESLKELKDYTTYQGIEVSGVPIDAYNQWNAHQNHTAGSNNNSWNQPYFPSVPGFYHHLVVNELGFLNVASNFKEFSGVIKESIDTFSCKLMM